MEYENLVKKIANSDRTETERGEVLIREMCRLMTDIVDYRYTKEHYEGGGTVIDDKRNNIKKSMSVVMSELDVYAEQLGVSDDVYYKKKKRLYKILDRM